MVGPLLCGPIQHTYSIHKSVVVLWLVADACIPNYVWSCLAHGLNTIPGWPQIQCQCACAIWYNKKQQHRYIISAWQKNFPEWTGTTHLVVFLCTLTSGWISLNNYHHYCMERLRKHCSHLVAMGLISERVYDNWECYITIACSLMSGYGWSHESTY